MDDLEIPISDITPENMPKIMVRVLAELQAITKLLAAMDGSVKEHEKYLFIFKVSRCSLDYVRKNDLLASALRYLGIIVAFFIVDWLSRAMYWSNFPKP